MVVLQSPGPSWPTRLVISSRCLFGTDPNTRHVIMFQWTWIMRCKNGHSPQKVNHIAITICVKIINNSVHLELCWLDQPISLPTVWAVASGRLIYPPYFQVDTPTCDVKLGGRSKPLGRANHAHAWRYNRSPLRRIKNQDEPIKKWRKMIALLQSFLQKCCKGVEEVLFMQVKPTEPKI